mgnify:CR=1 FL=1|jgi:hypothetical protein
MRVGILVFGHARSCKVIKLLRGYLIKRLSGWWLNVNVTMSI